MRLIQTLVPEGKHDTVVAVLEEEGVEFAMTEETADTSYSDVVFIPAEAEDVERIVERLRDVGVERTGYMMVSNVETIVSERFEEREAETVREDARISRDELRTTARDLSQSTTNYLLLTVISAVVATAGLLLNSAAVVVGSMVIAPLIGPAMASCVGTVINDDDLFWEGMRSQALGLAVAVVSATGFALLYRFTVGSHLDLLLVEQIAERAHPGMLALAIALGAGVAGALALTSGVDEALVGVMIAVALMPPAASVGLGIAYLEPVLAVGATVLVAVNLLSINTAGIVTIWLKRYRPSHWYDARRARWVTAERLAAFVLAVLLLTSFLAASSWDARQADAFEDRVEATLDDELGDALLGVEYEYRADVVSQSHSGVTVIVDESAERDGLAAHLQSVIRDRTGQDVDVTVLYQRTDHVSA